MLGAASIMVGDVNSVLPSWSLRLVWGNKYSNSKRAHSVRESAGRGSNEALMWCACRVRDSCPGEGHLSRVLHDG